MTPTVLALIPARGGSKGLPQKNIRLLCGKPLIAWTIEQARQSAIFTAVCVSTDAEGIASIAKEYGADVPFMRPESLATDTATSVDVVLHALRFYEEQGITFDYVTMLEPTSPLRKPDDLVRAFSLLTSNSEACSIVGVAQVESQHPAFLLTCQDTFIKPWGKPFCEGIIPALRRQDIEPVYYLEGSLYISDVSNLRQMKSFYHSKTLPYIVEKWQAFEIDDELDFEIITLLMQKIIS